MSTENDLCEYEAHYVDAVVPINGWRMPRGMDQKVPMVDSRASSVLREYGWREMGRSRATRSTGLRGPCTRASCPASSCASGA